MKPHSTKPADIYHPAFVKGLFSEMSATYGLTNLISSFGFCHRWRVQCVNQIEFKDGALVYDLMSGMGECWRHIERQLSPGGRLVGLDFCPEMCRRARLKAKGMTNVGVEILEADVLDNTLADESADCVVSTFGLKTFSDEQKGRLALEIKRLLKPQGTFSLLEISVPPSRPVRALYMFYLKHVIPRIGRMFLGNPDNYRMLGIYTERFKDCSVMARLLKDAGLEVEYRSFFLGCASSLRGRKV
jgi:demethylmenaquinone methyltransferase/2-methoxy-6-polyprenyl-1,4-benzoquinol methylase